MKTLADFKRALSVGTELRLIERDGKNLDESRRVKKLQTNSICFEKNINNEWVGSTWLDMPKSSLLEFDGKTAKIYLPALRDLTEEEKRIMDNEPKDQKQQDLDAISDGSVMYHRKKTYYEYSGKFYLFGTEKQDGKRLTTRDGIDKIEDSDLKGQLNLVYEFVETK